MEIPGLNLNAKEIVRLNCYEALKRIQAVLEEDGLDDESCFKRIEEIMAIYQDIGTKIGGRHDF